MSFRIATPELGKSHSCTNGGETNPNNMDNLNNIDNWNKTNHNTVRASYGLSNIRSYNPLYKCMCVCVCLALTMFFKTLISVPHGNLLPSQILSIYGILNIKIGLTLAGDNKIHKHGCVSNHDGNPIPGKTVFILKRVPVRRFGWLEEQIGKQITKTCYELVQIVSDSRITSFYTYLHGFMCNKPV